MSNVAIPSSASYPPTSRQAPAQPPVRSGSTTNTTLTPEALALIDKLKSRDTEVRQHEQAHLAAAGGLAVSGAAYTYQRGPNGVDYAVGGEVHIDTSPGRTPQETIARAHTIQSAALAPSEPSGADRAVAAQAQQLEQQARAQLAVEQAQKAVAPAEQAAAAPPVSGRTGAAVPASHGSDAAVAAPRPSAERLNHVYNVAPLVAPQLDIFA